MDNYFKVFKKIQGIKTRYPDLRFGQIVMNALGTYDSTKDTDMFFVEDKELFDALKNYEKLAGKFYNGEEK